MSVIKESFYVLIMAGGRGTRFWPRSRVHTPKQCLAVDGEASLLQRTIQRVKKCVPSERILVVTAADMEASVRSHCLDLPHENVLVEPEGRNTAPCVGWGLVEIGRRSRGEDAVMAVLPADHLILEEDRFVSQLLECAEAARATNALVTLGVSPTRPETGFGYLKIGGELGRWGESPFLRVKEFVEKPDHKTAVSYHEGGEHLWNAGMFVFSVEAIRDAYRAYLPKTWASLERLRHDPTLLQEVYPTLEKTSLDYGIMERSKHVLTVKACFEWSDVGSWSALGEHLPPAEGGVAVADSVVGIDATGNVVHAPGKAVALIGVSDLVVVETEDAILVCRKSDDQAVKEVVAELERRGMHALL